MMVNWCLKVVSDAVCYILPKGHQATRPSSQISIFIGLLSKLLLLLLVVVVAVIVVRSLSFLTLWFFVGGRFGFTFQNNRDILLQVQLLLPDDVVRP